MRYNEVYRVFREQKHIDLKIRMNNCNKTVKAKNRFKSVLEYALANGYGKELLKIVIRLYPESVKIVRDGIKKNTGLGNNEVLLLNQIRKRKVPFSERMGLINCYIVNGTTESQNDLKIKTGECKEMEKQVIENVLIYLNGEPKRVDITIYPRVKGNNRKEVN